MIGPFLGVNTLSTLWCWAPCASLTSLFPFLPPRGFTLNLFVSESISLPLHWFLFPYFFYWSICISKYGSSTIGYYYIYLYWFKMCIYLFGLYYIFFVLDCIIHFTKAIDSNRSPPSPVQHRIHFPFATLDHSRYDGGGGTVHGSAVVTPS